MTKLSYKSSFDFSFTVEMLILGFHVDNGTYRFSAYSAVFQLYHDDGNSAYENEIFKAMKHCTGPE